MIKWFVMVLGISCFPSLLQPQEKIPSEKEDVMIVNSGEVLYEGKEIVLMGEVSVQHHLGEISARSLSVKPRLDQGKGKGKFGCLKISHDVRLKLPEGGQLTCQEADVDYATMQAIFLGNDESPDVVYLNIGEKNENSLEDRPHLEVKSRQLILEMIRDPHTSKIIVKQMKAKDHIRVDYHHDYFLLADHAIYQRFPEDENRPETGLLTLSMHLDDACCQMSSLMGDHLIAKTIKVDTIGRQLWLENPSGILSMRQEKNPTQQIRLSANELKWDDQNQILTFKGGVKITQNETVHIETDQQLSIGQIITNGKKSLRFIQSPENTQIAYLDAVKNLTHRMFCPGKLLIDHEHQKMSLQGNGLGPLEEAKQVYVEDVLGDMYADHVLIDYSWQGRQLMPEKIVLDGHVRLLNRFDGHLEESGSILHYGLADHVEYFPKQQEMVLSGQHGNRVLFFDKVNNIQMSAVSLNVKHDRTLHKNAIQGMGDVRFTFIEKELEQIKERFRFIESSQNQDLGNVKSKK